MRLHQSNEIRPMTSKRDTYYNKSPTNASPSKLSASQWDDNDIHSNDSNKNSKSTTGTSPRPVPVRRIRSATNSSLLGKTPNSFAPITSHYALNDTLYQAFYRLLEKKHYQTALSVGLQFCRVALWDIPQHGYYNSPKYHDLQVKSAKNALHVSDVLSGVVVRCAKSLKANGGQDLYREKQKEVELVKNVARDHYHLIALQNINTFPSSNAEDTADALQKRPDANGNHVHHAGWMDILDCADINLHICPYSNFLSSVSEENDYEGDDDGVIGETKNGNERVGKGDLEKTNIPLAMQQPDEKRQRPQKQDLSKIEISRSSSAPAHLGKSIHSNSHPNVEIREPPPTATASVYEEENDEQLSTIHEYQTKEEQLMRDEVKTEEDLRFESDLERALYLSGLEIQPIHHQDTTTMTPTRGDGLAIQTLTKLYKDDFEEMRNNRSIHVSFLDTYQGRIRDSLNGCTVIAPLLAIHHLCNDDTLRQRNDILLQGKKEEVDDLDRHGTKNFGLHDETIRVVIDVQAAIVAPLVRQRVGLPKDALIIPSDVHDYLIDENFFRQDQFGGVYGGNIMDDEHLSKFIDTLSNFGRRQGVDIDTAEPVESRKIAATFFFHEHVISLHRVTRHVVTTFEDQGYRPQGATKKRLFNRLGFRKGKKIQTDKYDENAVMLTEEETWYEIIDSLPGAAMLNRDEDREQTGNDYDFHLKSTARIRCTNTKSLHACLRWYACSKFTPEDQKFIDSYQWNDRNVEFDPRVFQAFVWSD